ncbi:MAG: GTP-binding protein [Opitutaceae bacterium]
MKIPVILVTGFLGSGKTTFLREIARTRPEQRLLFLVNEFARTDHDSLALRSTGRPTHSVVGGSLFCECKAADFVRVMEQDVLAENRRQALDAVIIETSGIADPEAIGRIMRDFGLDIAFQIQRIVSLVSPTSFLKLVHTLPNIAAQIRTSDLVLINKTDLATEDAIIETESRIQAIHPGVESVRCTFGKAPFAFVTRQTNLPLAELATAASNPYTTRTLPFPTPVSKPALEAWLDALPPDILRVKGTLRTHQGWVHVDKTIESCELTPGTETEAPALVLIVPDEFESGLASLQGPTRVVAT